jgi:4-amino-4-deoxy-L-arabinose transferase-like glycosyltransferase
VVAGLTLLALALRAPNLGRAYWVDEGISIGIASHPLRQLPGLLRQDGSPPLFYVLLHYWMAAFGTSEVATHLLTLLTSLLAVPLAYWAGRELFDRRAGIAAAALVATNPFMNWYSTETRMYPLVICLSIAGITFAWRAVRDRNLRDAIAAVVVFTALLYTHNWGLYLAGVTACVLFGLAVVRDDRSLAKGVALAAGAVILLWLPWLPSFLDQARNTAAPWAIRPNIGDFFADPSSALGGTLGFLIAPLLGLGVLWSRQGRRLQYESLASLICAIGLLGALAGFLGAQIEPSWTVRYLAVIVGPLLLAAAGALSTTRRGVAVVIAACVLLVGWSAIGTLLPNPDARYAKSNVAALAHQVGPLLRPGDVVVLTQTEQSAVVAHYLPPGLEYVTPTGPVSDPYVVDWRNLVERLEAANPCQAVGATINAVPLGTQVLEIDPARRLGASGTAWSKTVNARVVAVDDLLAGDTSLSPEASFAPAMVPRPFSPVRAVLYRKVAGPAACA